jgi:hypothetical protein
MFLGEWYVAAMDIGSLPAKSDSIAGNFASYLDLLGKHKAAL